MQTGSGQFSTSPVVEMKAAAAEPTLVPKAEDKEHQEDAEMEDLFGNDDNVEAKEERDGMNLPG
jgi:hypothetical protein